MDICFIPTVEVIAKIFSPKEKPGRMFNSLSKFSKKALGVFQDQNWVCYNQRHSYEGAESTCNISNKTLLLPPKIRRNLSPSFGFPFDYGRRVSIRFKPVNGSIYQFK